MHRPFWLRALIAVWGLWFTTSVVEPAGLFACEMHGGIGGHAAMAAPSVASASAAGMTHGTAMPMDHVQHVSATTTQAAASDASTPSQNHHACCTCLGHCCQTAPVAAPETTATLAALIERASDVAIVTVATRGITRRPYELPFANGPPLSSLT